MSGGVFYNTNMGSKNRMFNGYNHWLATTEWAKRFTRAIIADSSEDNVSFQFERLFGDEGIMKGWTEEDCLKHFKAILEENDLDHTSGYRWIFRKLEDSSTSNLGKGYEKVFALDWIAKKPSLKDFIKAMEAYSHLFKENSLEGLKIALSGRELKEEDFGVLQLVPQNGLESPYQFVYLIDQLRQKEYIKSASINKTYNFLTGLSSTTNLTFSNHLGKCKNEYRGDKSLGNSWREDIEKFVKNL